MPTARETVEALRRLADTIEAVDAAGPLPDLYIGLGVQVCDTGAREADRIAAVTRLSLAMDNDRFESHTFEDGTVHFKSAYGHPNGYAYTALDPANPAGRRDGLCDRCDEPATGGAAGGGEPPEAWCSAHEPDWSEVSA